MDNPYPICANCIFVDESLDKEPCQECNRAFLSQRIKPNFVSNRKLKTNGDRIRAMTDEELAKKMSGLESFVLTCGGEWPPEKWLDWLKKEVE